MQQKVRQRVNFVKIYTFSNLYILLCLFSVMFYFLPYGPFCSSSFNVRAWGCSENALFKTFFFKRIRFIRVIRVKIAEKNRFFWEPFDLCHSNHLGKNRIFYDSLKLLISYCPNKITSLSVNAYSAKLGSISWNCTIVVRFCMYIRNSFGITRLSNAFFQLSLSIAWLFYELRFNCCLGVVTTYSHHYIETHFAFRIFVSMSRPRSIYVVFMWFIFLFQYHFHCHYSCNEMK